MYTSIGINDSPTISGIAAAAIASGAFKAVAFDSNGAIVVAGAGANVLGILPATTNEAVAAADDVTIQIKDIGYWKAGAAIAAGAELTPNATGLAVTAVAGNYVSAIALEAAGSSGDVIKVQIVKSGLKGISTLAALADVAITSPTDGQALKYDTTTTKWINEADAVV